MLLSLVPGGNPAVRILGDQATPESVAALNTELGLDDPVPIRYARWLGDVLQGDLGRSTDLNQNVSDVLKDKLPVTIQLAVMSLGIGILFAIPLGVLSAWKAGSRLDKVVTSISFAVLSLPGFLVAIALLIVFAVNVEGVAGDAGVGSVHRVTVHQPQEPDPAGVVDGDRRDRRAQPGASLGHDRGAPERLRRCGQGKGIVEQVHPVPSRPARRR